MTSQTDRKIKDVRDIWGTQRDDNKNSPHNAKSNNGDSGSEVYSKHKYKTLERHLSMKKTIRKKMMRDLRDIGDATTVENNSQTVGFLEQIRTDQQPSPNVDKPSLWKRLTKSWTNHS